MILFYDTSALMKAYAVEQHSQQVRTWLEEATASYVSLITWAEMCAAFGMKERTQQISNADVAAGLARLAKEWRSFGKIAVDEDLMIKAGEFALRFGLRAHDSVQLASVQRVHQQLGSNLVFCCFDKQLNEAATELGIAMTG